MLLRILAVAALTGPALAQQEPLTFKNFAIGAPRADVLGAFAIPPACDGSTCVWSPAQKCQTMSPASPSSKDCSTLTYAGFLPIRMEITFKDDKLAEVTMIFPRENFAAIKAALEQRFGSSRRVSARGIGSIAVIGWRDDTSLLRMHEQRSQAAVSVIGLEYQRQRDEKKDPARAKDL